MELGFETIGNATVICHDRGPVLATDPWLVGPAYFGSWIHQHAIPNEQMEAIRACRFVWISHGHPDHLSHDSLELLRDKRILLPDHYGGRIHRELEAENFEVTVLEDGRWTPLSDRLRILSLADCHQDAALLIDLDGHLIIDANDAADRGAGAFVRERIAEHEDTYLLALIAHGDADMIHLYDEDGHRVEPEAARREPLGPGIAGILHDYGIRHYVPFSTLHKYQRTDSAWANEYITRPEDMRAGFESDSAEILPPYVHRDLAGDEVRALEPPPNPDDLHEPEEFGDSWSDELEAEDVGKLRDYFARVSHLKTFLGHVNFRVGGRDNVIDIAPEHRRGITFETPRASLMTAVEHRIFDDLMIGNFTKTTLHGDWGGKSGAAALYPDFNPFVTKYGDNGGAYTAKELRAYFADYRRRGFFARPTDAEAERSLRPYLG